MIKINGTTIKTPSSFQWSLQDLSSEDSGRTLDGVAHKDIIAQKRKLDCGWSGLTSEETSTILQTVNTSAIFKVTYPDAMSGTNETRKFYVGDRSAPVMMWTADKKIYSSLSFNFIEQ
jgi:hypothetical protein